MDLAKPEYVFMHDGTRLTRVPPVPTMNDSEIIDHVGYVSHPLAISLMVSIDKVGNNPEILHASIHNHKHDLDMSVVIWLHDHYFAGKKVQVTSTKHFCGRRTFHMIEVDNIPGEYSDRRN